VDPEHTAQTELTEIAAGLVRLAWSAELQAQGIAPTADVVRAALAEAFAGGARRVVVHQDPDHTEGHRIGK
jgi:hypothetical protein